MQPVISTTVEELVVKHLTKSKWDEIPYKKKFTKIQINSWIIISLYLKLPKVQNLYSACGVCKNSECKFHKEFQKLHLIIIFLKITPPKSSLNSLFYTAWKEFFSHITKQVSFIMRCVLTI